MSAPELAAEVRGLTRRFGKRTALDGVDLDVRAGEIFGLLGPNGGGKSTLFRILSTLLPPTSGTARVLGKDVATEAAAVRAGIGVVFQTPSLDKKLTVAENLRHQGRLYGLSGPCLSTRMAELLTRFELADRAGDLVETLSGGLARRVEIAKGLLHSPRLLLLDEPSTGLDPAARRGLWRQLVQARTVEAVTVLLTTHLLDEADGCDRLALLDGGKVVAHGTPGELKSAFSGSMIYVDTSDPPALAARLRESLALEPRIADARLHLEHADPFATGRRIAEAFPDLVDSVAIGKPTLGDVFLARTGHSLYVDGEASA